MNKELILAIEALERKWNRQRDYVWCYRKVINGHLIEFDKADNGEVVLDRRTGDFHLFRQNCSWRSRSSKVHLILKRKVCICYRNRTCRCKKIKPACQLGDVITIEVKSEEFSRKAAKNAKNTIVKTIKNRKRMHSTTSFTLRRRKSLQVLYRELTTMVIWLLILEEHRRFLRQMITG